MTEMYLNIVRACMVVGFLLALDFVLEVILVQNVKDRKKSLKLRVLLRYILVFTFLFSMAKIWVEGFGYLLTFVGIIAAALTITQKEYLMNFFGWLIVIWRDLFAEGDYIEAGKYVGYVKKIGLFYFSLEEASDFLSEKTGRMIKIPNSLIANTPIINFSAGDAFIEGKVQVVFSLDSSLQSIKSLVAELDKQCEQFLNSLYGKSNLSLHKPLCILRIHQDKPLGIQLRLRYLSLRQDQKIIEDNIFSLIMKAVNSDEELLISTTI